MESVVLGRSALTVSRLGMGCNKLGALSLRHRRRDAVALVEIALAAGIRLFDTADAYGSGASEAVLGDALSGAGDDVVVCTKVGYRFTDRTTTRGLLTATAAAGRRALPFGGDRNAAYARQDFSADYVRTAVDGCRRRLRREQIDVLQFHGPPAASSTDLPDVIARLRDDGIIRAFGAGCESVEVAASWLEVDGLDCVQLPYGVLDPQAADALLPEARRRGVGIIVRGVLGGGVLARFLRHEPTGIEPAREERLRRLQALARSADVEMPQLAVWYAQCSAPIDALLLGMNSVAQIADGVRWSTAELPADGVLAELTAIVDGTSAS